MFNGRVIFSKSELGRFPIEGEVEETLAAIREGREPPAPQDPHRPTGFISRVIGKIRN